MKYLSTIFFLMFFCSVTNSQNRIMKGSYILISAANEMVLNAFPSGLNNNENIGIDYYNGRSQQEFAICFNDAGLFTLRSINSNKLLFSENDSIAALSIADRNYSNSFAAGNFYLEPVMKSDLFMIVNNNNGNVLSVNTANGEVSLTSKPAECENNNSELNKYWRVAQRVSFKNIANEKIMRVSVGGGKKSDELLTGDNDNNTTQAFDLIPVLNANKFYIRSVAAKKYLTVDNGELKTGIPVQISEFTGEVNQQFSIKEVRAYTYQILTGNKYSLTPRNTKSDAPAQIIIDDGKCKNCSWELLKYNPKIMRDEDEEVNW